MSGRLPDGLIAGDDGRARCWWCAGHDDYLAYHDDEWGRPVRDDRRLFEKICLEGFQSGLSWLTILRKREGFRRAFADFDFERIARFDRRRVDRLVADAGIVRHRGKIESVVNNARRAAELVDEVGSRAAEARDPGGPRGSRSDRGLDGAQPRPQEARLELRRPDHLLRLHAGDGPRERPPRRLPRARRGRARAVRARVALASAAYHRAKR